MGIRNAYRAVVLKHPGNRSLARSNISWMGDNNVDLRLVGYVNKK
jgi:hypothetical protein